MANQIPSIAKRGAGMIPRRVLALAVSALLLVGCQSVDVASVEEALRGMAVSMPPRDPFAGLEDVPRSLADIEDTEDCGKLPEKNLTEWVKEKRMP
jgi:hypothetical protein